jgi:hypothetical protein
LVHITQGQFATQRVKPDRHIAEGPNKTSLRPIEDGLVHITQGRWATQRVPPDRHIADGPNKSGLKQVEVIQNDIR